MKSVTLAVFLFVSTGLLLASPVDQPHMESARANLQKARAQLQVAAQNKGGHRAKALGLVNQAITAVNRGIQYDRRHNHAQLAMNVSVTTFDQPHMERALQLLMDARSDLEKATTDKGGFRVQAINLIKQAIEEVKMGIAAGM